MAEIGETPPEVPEDPVDDRSDDDVVVRTPKTISRRAVLGGLLGLGALSTKTGRRLASVPLEKLGILDTNTDKNRELPPLPEFKSPDPDQRVLVVPLLDGGEKEPLTQAQIGKALESVTSNYDRFSFGNLQYSFKVLPWQTADLPSDRVNLGDVLKVGDEALKSENIERLEEYQTRLYILPPGKDDKWGGRGSYSPINGYKRAVSHVYDNDDFTFSKVAIHELGHTLGIPHANSIDNADKSVEYGGSDDPMGSTGNTLGYELNAPQRVAMGWVSRDQVQSVVNDGEFTLYPLDIRYSEQEAVSKVLRFKKPNTNEVYYLSLRAQASGNFSLELHRWNEKHESPSLEVNVPVKNKDVGWIDNEEEFYDEENGIRIKQLSRVSLYSRTPDAGTVRLQVTFDKK
ncbi:MAG TPA: hypothetical protein VNA13_04365 [Xanthomonadales bacterium]|nr:hypothetical protein [Xanthomonadales bacterium]